MIVWVKNELTNKWSKETTTMQSISDVYQEMKMNGTQYLALALVLKSNQGYRVEVYWVSETETEEVDSFPVKTLASVTEKLNELWNAGLTTEGLTPKISKMKQLFGGDSFVQNSFQKSETGSFLKPVYSMNAKSSKPKPCVQKPCIQDYQKEAVEKQARENEELRLKYDKEIGELKKELKQSKDAAALIEATISQSLLYGKSAIDDANNVGQMSLQQINTALQSTSKRINVQLENFKMK